MRQQTLALAIMVALATPVLAQSPVPTRQIGAATLQNVPEIPAAIDAAVQRYQSYRSAQFQDWLADGSMLITTRFGDTNQLHRVTAPGAAREQLTWFKEPVADATTIPGTSRFALSRDTGGDEWFQLEIMAAGKPPVRLTELGTRNLAPVFSSDGALLLWSRATKGSSDYTIMAANPNEPASRREIFRFPGAISPADISADGKTALLVRGVSNRETELHLLDIASGKATRIAPKAKAARYEDPQFVNNGRAVLTISNRESDVRRLIEVDVATGAVTPVSPPLAWDIEAFALSKDGRILAYAINEDGFSRIVVQDRVTKRALPQPALPAGVLTALKFTDDGTTLAIGLQTAKSAGDTWAWGVTSAQLTRWTVSELGPLDAAQLAEPSLIRVKSFDGLEVPALVYRPTRLVADAKTPVIIDIHGGPEAQTRPGWNPGAQYFADVLGATVILPNVRGSDGYGTRYLNLDNAEKREDSVKDIGALLDWVAKQPNLDSGKVAVYGQSYGGYMSLASMTFYSDRLVGGVERYGISDFRTFLERTEAYRRDNRRAEYGDERDPKMQQVFARIAPIANVGKITKPMLVMQGANDPRVPQFESDQVVEKLRAQSLETWYVVFADEGHGFLKKPNNDLRRAVETLFLQKLFGQP